jgi:hypothetical protein
MTPEAVPNNTKLFAQADIDMLIKYYLSSDQESNKIYDFLKISLIPRFQFINLSIPFHETFGILNL